jgi:CubicO group peptidase (beta-lactamase class C family)
MEQRDFLENVIWETASPEAVGIPSDAVIHFLQELEKEKYCLHAFMLMRHGKLCFSAASAPYTLDTPHRVFSAGKSILALSVFFAMRDMLSGDTRFDTMTVRDVLTMRTGQTDDPFVAILRDLDADLTRLFFSVPPVEAPGTTFRYNNTVPHIVYSLAERATGIPFEQYQQSHLCGPLHAPVIAPTNNLGQYNPVVMAMSANTLLKFAQFFLQEGEWKGKQLLDSSYIREAASLKTRTGLVGNSAEYGYQIWRNAFGGYRMDGGWGQYAIILPEFDLAAVILSDMPDSSFALKAFETELVRYLSPAPLYENTASASVLRSLGESLTLAPEGGNSSSPDQDIWFQRVYNFPAQQMNMRFDASEGKLILTVSHAGTTQRFSCGLSSSWEKNARHLFVEPERTVDNGVYCLDKNECLLSGTWRSGSVFEMTGKSLGALGRYLYRFTFSHESLTVEFPCRVCRGSTGLQDAVCWRSERGEADNASSKV